jgi:DNA polymerase-3 subunit gamma/tau
VVSEPDRPTPAPVSAATAPIVPFPSRDDLVQAWGDHIIGRLRPKAKALFQAGRFVGVEGERGVFGLPNEIHRSRCVEMQPEIEAALADHFGRPVPLDLVVEAGVEGAVRTTTSPGSSDPGGGSVPPPAPSRPLPPVTVAADPPPDDGPVIDEDDLSVFDESQLGDIAEVDNSAESRVLQAFPGAEEVR